MSSNQEAIYEFPDDDNVWLIKWIDEFHQNHFGSRTAFVSVLLQKLPALTSTDIATMPQALCWKLLGKDNPDPHFLQIYQMVGMLPTLTIGDIYQRRKLIGRLQHRTTMVALLPGESDSDEYRLKDDFPKPPGWPDRMPCRVLNKSEYDGFANHHLSPGSVLMNSKCVVLRRRDGRHTELFIIPRTIIFKAFYAQHSDIARAFSTGPWERQLEDVICTHDIESGQKTEVSEDGKWNIVLRPRIDDDYCWVLAVFYHDPYGRKCANLIHTMRMRDTGSQPNGRWYASARIPLTPVTENLKLNVRCLPLKTSWYYDDDRQRCEVRKFLVTEITGSNFPKHYPLVAVGRTNRNGEGLNQEPTSRPAPYPNHSKAKLGDSDTVLTSQVDALANSGSTIVKGAAWQWEVKPPRETIKKTLSKIYPDPPPPIDVDEGDVVSTGELTDEGRSKPKAEVKTLTITPNVQFAHLISCFEELTRQGFFDSFSPVPARHPRQQTTRNHHEVWALIDEETRLFGHRPLRAWHVLDMGKKSGHGILYRTALVILVQYQGRKHYWIQIERKRPREGYRSPVLSNMGPDPYWILEYALELIVGNEGRKLKDSLLRRLSSEDVRVETYKHDYNDERTAISLQSIKNFFETHFGKRTAGHTSE